jgi:hypothetical protein
LHAGHALKKFGKWWDCHFSIHISVLLHKPQQAIQEHFGNCDGAAFLYEGVFAWIYL